MVGDRHIILIDTHIIFPLVLIIRLEPSPVIALSLNCRLRPSSTRNTGSWTVTYCYLLFTSCYSNTSASTVTATPGDLPAAAHWPPPHCISTIFHFFRCLHSKPPCVSECKEVVKLPPSRARCLSQNLSLQSLSFASTALPLSFQPADGTFGQVSEVTLTGITMVAAGLPVDVSRRQLHLNGWL